VGRSAKRGEGGRDRMQEGREGGGRGGGTRR